MRQSAAHGMVTRAAIRRSARANGGVRSDRPGRQGQIVRGGRSGPSAEARGTRAEMAGKPAPAAVMSASVGDVGAVAAARLQAAHMRQPSAARCELACTVVPTTPNDATSWWAWFRAGVAAGMAPSWRCAAPAVGVWAWPTTSAETPAAPKPFPTHIHRDAASAPWMGNATNSSSNTARRKKFIRKCTRKG